MYKLYSKFKFINFDNCSNTQNIKFKEVKLYTHKLEQMFQFYTETLGCELVQKHSDFFTIKIGWTKFTFKTSEKSHLYYYCFLIPSNKLNEALEWTEQRLDVIEIENERKTQVFDTWNAESFYFYDASGSIAEFIVRYDLENELEEPFNISQVLCLNEMGIPTLHIKKLNHILIDNIGTSFWKGDLERFGTNGSQEELFLFPNYNEKEIWFPSDFKIKPEPFSAIVENNGKQFSITYKDEELLVE